MHSIRDLVLDMVSGRVDFLIIIGGNPVFNAPADIRFRDGLSRTEVRVHLSLYQNETSELCHWNIPEAHFLESWSDARAYDGTASILQPLIAPLYEGKSAHELLSVMTETPGRSSYEVVKEYWRSRMPVDPGPAPARSSQPQLSSGEFEKLWQVALHDGL